MCMYINDICMYMYKIIIKNNKNDLNLGYYIDNTNKHYLYVYRIIPRTRCT